MKEYDRTGRETGGWVLVCRWTGARGAWPALCLTNRVLHQTVSSSVRVCRPISEQAGASVCTQGNKKTTLRTSLDIASGSVFHLMSVGGLAGRKEGGVGAGAGEELMGWWLGWVQR